MEIGNLIFLMEKVNYFLTNIIPIVAIFIKANFMVKDNLDINRKSSKNIFGKKIIIKIC